MKHAAAPSNTVLGLEGKVYLILDFSNGLGYLEASNINNMKQSHIDLKSYRHEE